MRSWTELSQFLRVFLPTLKLWTDDDGRRIRSSRLQAKLLIFELRLTHSESVFKPFFQDSYNNCLLFTHI